MARSEQFVVNGIDLNVRGLSCSVEPSAWLQAQIQMRTRQLAAGRERYSRQLLERRLPRWLHWLLDHPRFLKRMLRIARHWQPIMTVIPLRTTATAETAVHLSERWLQEQEARGRDVSGGHVFTYTDANGLPAEVYGP